jgi:tRNA pseudouridine38-40 synthase
MRDYRMTLAYDGTAYCGWQIQPGQPTVQEVLETALARIVGQQVRVTASGRTDAGVHARGQVASFRCDTRLEPAALRRALDAVTPDDIHIRDVCVAPEGFHAIRDAISKRYRYQILDGPQRDVFLRAYAWHLPTPLDEEAMRQAASYLLGRHDFSSFEAAGAPRKSSVRTVSELTVSRVILEDTRPLVVEIESDGFLYNMVRNIVGTLVMVGRGQYEAGWVREVLRARCRAEAGPTAPACGLMLLSVRYAW